MNLRHVLSNTLSLFLVSLALALIGTQPPRVASAATLVVDNNSDASGQACTGSPGDCSLRSAIQIANSNGVADTITFSSNFTITLTSSLPDLAENGTTIDGGNLIASTAWINGNNVVTNIFRITGSDITLDGLRLYGSGSTYSNIWITGTAQRVTISNNAIGDNDLGFLGSCGNSPNSYGGIYIDSTAAPSGSDAVAWIYGNYIKCNRGAPGDGIDIVGTDKVVIGADAAGNAGDPEFNFTVFNLRDGVRLSGAANNNTIRNSNLAYNNNAGLVIDASSSNVVAGNFAQANFNHGIVLQNGATLNRIGCALGGANAATDRNMIRDNVGSGLSLTGSGTNSNQVFCNWIGLNDSGTGADYNGVDGVTIDLGAQSNVIGSTDAERNVISGNNRDGVMISGSGTKNNLVAGNYIGTNVTGTGAVANGDHGVVITNTASVNTVGGNNVNNLNLIAGNTGSGVWITGSNTTTNTVLYNDIGYNSFNSTPIPNNMGVTLENGAHHNVIGGAGGASNYLASNLIGLYLGGASSNTIRTNSIFSNTLEGIVLYGASYNVISGTTIYNNGGDGIGEDSGSGPNVWQHVSIYNNGGLGIDKNADSLSTNIPDGPFPVIVSVNPATGVVTGTASANAFVELYQVAPDPSGLGEGKTFVGSDVSNGAGVWSITVSPGLRCFTAFQTVGFIIYDSSEFGPNNCRGFLPLIRK